MKSFRDILEKIGEYLLHFAVVLSFLIIIGIAVGISYYFYDEYRSGDSDKQQIQEYSESGLSEEICKISEY